MHGKIDLAAEMKYIGLQLLEINNFNIRQLCGRQKNSEGEFD